MDPTEAIAAFDDLERVDRPARIRRLQELAGLLPDQGEEGFASRAADWLFEDVKTTWIYGCLAATVVTAHAFCWLQLAAAIRELPDDPDLGESPLTLEALAAYAAERGIVGLDTQVRLTDLHDGERRYEERGLHQHDGRLERHIAEIAVPEGEALLEDARQALRTACALLFRK